ncbi:peptidyl-alpha-hydroxyglycine alpha-amidating lyase 2 isoform X2 [Eurytemora carolleeae]|uniref:peptidyl-alpha-hydroxyglycine alpha-amidating lyase 2 isoform X2 n=1 Tax=Eurytemora carolleeae TaxID=1294199 RepID=UPI000C768E1A|nr:peptidyl-alpha-hydroxyglycine alpha-amidating lyase 2 isoform X2 [Eurytemora carolleeae]|eukprot:XP_023329830.1 peptidyl-alpha-hydroxyglycine alpha-amidating lyase 2-like isoform X2 [Eurytemora affinis]
MGVAWLFLGLCIWSKQSYGASVLDLAELVSEYEDEILGRAVGFTHQDPEPQNGGEVGHPEEVHNWDTQLELGQVAGVTTDLNDDPVVFHRGPVVWDMNSFTPDNKLSGQDQPPIPVDTILTIDQFTGKVKSGKGANLFYMPHGIYIDQDRNTWVTDVGLHQVMMFPPDSDVPSLVLGERFVPGSDKQHFCKPAAVAVSKSGNVYVADGYCNQRIVVFDIKGRYLTEIKGDWTIVHSIVLFEEEDTVCVADREGEKISCVGAGLNHPQFMGARILDIPNLGRVYGIAGRGTALVGVTGQGSTPPHGITIDLADEGRVVDTWGSELQNPHLMAVSREGDTIYVTEIGPNRVRKFDVVAPQDNIFNQEM